MTTYAHKPIIGLDLAKSVFHAVEMNSEKPSKPVVRKKLRRGQMLPFFANHPPACVAMEACASAHYWAREIEKLGHEVKLLPPRDVRPFVSGNKNDYNDAVAIAEASQRPTIHVVRMKTVPEQDRQAWHRMRDLLVGQRTAQINQIRGRLGEYGVVIPQGARQFCKAIPEILEDGENGLSDRFRKLLNDAYAHLRRIDERIEAYEQELIETNRQDEEIQRLQTIPGYGPMVSSAFKTAIGDGRAFDSGRDVAAYLGLVPKQHSSGDKTVLLGISKRGNKRLRTLLVHGARAVVAHAEKKSDAFSRWVVDVIARRGSHKAIVAVANKLARIGWAVLVSGKPYQLKLVAA